MHAQWISIPTDGEKGMTGYLSLPPTGTGPGIVLVQEIWGVNEHIRTVADQYALSGYVVLAPDIFWRMAPRVDLAYNEAGNKQAFEYYGRVDTALGSADVAATVHALRALPQVKGKVATLGYCLGGQFAFRAAALSKADAAVCFYGGGIDQHLDVAASIDQPILFHHAMLDDHITPAKVAAIKSAFASKHNATFFDYPGVGHAFNSWGRPEKYNQRASAMAHGRTLEFLAEHL